MLPVSKLSVGDKFKSADRKCAGAVLRVTRIQKRPNSNEYLITATTKRYHTIELAMPGKSMVKVLGSETTKCKCRNHLGKSKVLYPTRTAAVDSLLYRHLKHGAHRIYECPTVAGRYHLTSKT